MAGTTIWVKRAAGRLWRGLREWCGDASYDRYLQCRARKSTAEPLLSREEFYLDQLRKRYSRVSRCC